MNKTDLLQSIIAYCEREIGADDNLNSLDVGDLARRDFAQAILGMVTEAGKETKVFDPGLVFDPRLVEVEMNGVTIQGHGGPGLLRLQRAIPLVFLDLETTDKDRNKAKIIEVAAVKIHPDGRRETLNHLIDPGFPISEEITQLTGITNEEIQAFGLPFHHHGKALLEFLHGSILVGYNIRNYDAPVLWAEFYAMGIAWNIQQEEILDAMEVFYKMEPRTLEGAVYFYLGREHAGAHRALADVEATIAVMDAQMAKYQGLPDDIDTLIAETKKDRRVDMAGCFALNDQGVVCFNFGKHGPSDGREATPCHLQRGYLRWMLEQDFPANTKMVAQYVLDQTAGRGY